MSTPSPFAAAAHGVHLQVKLAPKAKANRIQGLEPGAGGKTRLKVQVTAAPEKGRANEALVALLARAWRIPQRTIHIVAGAHDRKKMLLIEGDPALLLKRLDAWARTLRA